MSRWLRRVCVVGGAAWLLAVGAVPVFASDGSTRVARHGIELVVPAGWWTSDYRMSSGVEPVFRMTLSDRRLRRTAFDSGPCYGGIARQIQPDGVVAILREALGADFKPYASSFAQDGSCCRLESRSKTTRAWATTRHSSCSNRRIEASTSGSRLVATLLKRASMRCSRPSTR